MTRKLKRDTLATVLSEMDVEDRAIKYLARLPHQVAAVTALKTESELARVWGFEACEMRSRNDPRPVYQSTEKEQSWVYLARVKYRQTPFWNAPSDAIYRNLFATLTRDAAAFVAYKVARYVLRWEELT